MRRRLATCSASANSGSGREIAVFIANEGNRGYTQVQAHDLMSPNLVIGCTVLSWSKVAIRSSGGTNLGLALSVVAFTKATIACFAGPSFQDGRGSVCA